MSSVKFHYLFFVLYISSVACIELNSLLGWELVLRQKMIRLSLPQLNFFGWIVLVRENHEWQNNNLAKLQCLTVKPVPLWTRDDKRKLRLEWQLLQVDAIFSCSYSEGTSPTGRIITTVDATFIIKGALWYMYCDATVSVFWMQIGQLWPSQ